MDKPKKLILDYSTWRSGENGKHAVGEGRTELRNREGFCCCIGQWSIQCGADPEELVGHGEPNEIKTLIPLFAEEEGRDIEEWDELIDGPKSNVYAERHTTPLAWEAITINDDPDTTPDNKIIELKELLERNGIELEVINKPY
jgi:hypothetical protein